MSGRETNGTCRAARDIDADNDSAPPQPVSLPSGRRRVIEGMCSASAGVVVDDAFQSTPASTFRLFFHPAA